MSRTAYFQTFGCQMNEHDTLRLADQLSSRGFTKTDEAEGADLIVINTCSVRDHAVQKALSELGRLREHDSKIVVAGCVAQMSGESLIRKYKDIDLVLGPDNVYQIGSLVDRVFAGERIVAAELDESAGFQFLAAQGARSKQIAAFVTVQKGCDKNCSYCIVPSVRGREVSRKLEDIVAEVERLIAGGVREVTLLGQNIDAYHDPEGRKFDVALRTIGSLPGLMRLRFTTGHPNDFTQAMADAMAEVPTICEHLHLPVQHGADAILKRMYRGYTRKRYLEKIAMVRAQIPNLTLTTDLIVGFPGETEEDFLQTLEVVEEAQFDSAFCFTYSVRPGTPAQGWGDSVPEPLKKERLQRLLEATRNMSAKRMQRHHGQVMEVLTEGPSRLKPEVMTGRTRHNTVVNFVGEVPPGSLVNCLLHDTGSGFHLRGELVSIGAADAIKPPAVVASTCDAPTAIA